MSTGSGSRQIQLHFRDNNALLVEAWKSAFGSMANVSIAQDDIFGTEADAIVSPANSFGYMDGGIDAAYLARFGDQLQGTLQSHLRRHHHGELPVGQAVIVETGADDLPWLISAPTMRIPQSVRRTVNAYLALRAALLAALTHNEGNESPITSILCPGLASGIGGLSPATCAKQMRLAVDVVLHRRAWPQAAAWEVLQGHRDLAGT